MSNLDWAWKPPADLVPTPPSKRHNPGYQKKLGRKQLRNLAKFERRLNKKKQAAAGNNDYLLKPDEYAELEQIAFIEGYLNG
jgi:hypothetical protein